MKLFSVCIILIITITFFVSMSFADSMECGNRLINDGDKKYEVLLKCGEPFFKEETGEQTIIERHRQGAVKTTERIEKWYYNLGTYRFIRILTFKGDTLISIETGDMP